MVKSLAHYYHLFFLLTIVFLSTMEDLNFHVVEALPSLIIIPSILLLFQFRRFPHLNVSAL